MATLVIMPRQGQSVESCIVTTWNKKKGDKVNVGDTLFSYETDKSSFDEVSEVEGTLLEIFVEEGDDVPCLDPVCVIGNEGEDYSALVPAKAGDAAEAAPEVKEEKTQTVESAAPVVSEATPVASVGGKLKISPRAKNLAIRTNADLLKVSATGPSGRVIERDVLSLLDRGLTVSSAALEEYLKGGVMIDGTGANGKVVLEDLGKSAETVVSAAATETAAEYEDVKLPNIRKVIAKSMHASLSTMAQLTLNTSFDATDIMNYRAMLKANADKLGLANITFNDMVLFAVAKTLGNHKDLNAHYLDDTMRYFKDVHLGIAVDTDRGLMVPTLFNANKLSLNDLSKNAKVIISEAQSGTISPDKLKGASFTVTNLGSMGIESFTPVINPPQTGILGVDNITRRVKEVNGKDVFYPAMGLSLTFDHRALDGAPAAKFLKELCNNLENFSLLMAK